MNHFLALRTAAKAIGINHETLRKAIRNGELRAYRADPFSLSSNPQVRVKLDEVRAWQEKQVYRPSQNLVRRSEPDRIAPRGLREMRTGGQDE